MRPKPIAVWHETVAAKDLAPFEALFADDIVFESPAVHTPQVGKALASLYLRSALLVLNNETFRYTDEWLSERSAVLQFFSKVDGLEVNGVDIIRWNDEERITHFKVMVRPLKGLNALVGVMAKELQAAKH